MNQKRLYVPKGQTLEYQSLDVPELLVNGTLHVNGALTAKHIQGSGVIRAESIRFRTMRIGVADAEALSGYDLMADQVLCTSCHVNNTTTVKSYLQAAELQTGDLSVGLSSIAGCKADSITVLEPKKRGLLRLALASWLRSVRALFFWKRGKERRKPAAKAGKAPRGKGSKLDPAAVQAVMEYLTEHNLIAAPEAGTAGTFEGAA